MRKLSVLVLSLLLSPAIASAQSAGPPPPPQNVVLDLEKKPFKGDRKAKLTLVEFSDYQ